MIIIDLAFASLYAAGILAYLYIRSKGKRKQKPPKFESKLKIEDFPHV